MPSPPFLRRVPNKDRLSPIDDICKAEEEEEETDYTQISAGEEVTVKAAAQSSMPIPPIPMQEEQQHRQERKTSKGFLRDDGKPRSFHYGWQTLFLAAPAPLNGENSIQQIRQKKYNAHINTITRILVDNHHVFVLLLQLKLYMR